MKSGKTHAHSHKSLQAVAHKTSMKIYTEHVNGSTILVSSQTHVVAYHLMNLSKRHTANFGYRSEKRIVIG